ncbi:hypothetical protein ABAC460_21600 [Asticcacaulis sp. AC460]|uniref:tetratricopeptide repeat protein n=1 Tax=Asticcacaulis sp. AC460 TaxID=1282360 RepID=UPI0003C3E374|nr:tetratricopeptide repeat protein [Asticcacaulis sp. AC460]ESQ86978.1 hypothetical protein ABAC460_21600 [Asticcacaulis sp. AC460]
MPVLADVGKPVYVACWAHQTDKNRVMWTRPFVANDNEISAAKEQFAGYIVNAGYVKSLSVVSTSCVWNKKSEKTVADINRIKASFNYSTDIGVNFIYKPFSEVSAGKQLHVQCEVHKTAASCTAYGLAFEQGNRGQDKDDTQAAAYYQMGCGMGDPVGCRNLAILYAEGRGVPVDHAAARRFYEKACNGGEALSCYNLGVAHATGTGGPTDVAQGLAFYQKACDLKFANGCNNLGWHYETGTGIAADRAKGLKFYGQACDLGSTVGCNNLALLKSQNPDLS